MVKVRITSANFIQHCRVLARKVEITKIKYRGIVTIARGGLPVATAISNYLDLPIVDILSIKSYSQYNEKKENMKFNFRFDTCKSLREHGKFLIIDDISDTGETLEFVKKHFPNSDVLTLYYKESTRCLPKYSIQAFEDSIWIEFPWEYSHLNKYS